LTGRTVPRLASQISFRQTCPIGVAIADRFVEIRKRFDEAFGA
jgi:hypothetical protein